MKDQIFVGTFFGPEEYAAIKAAAKAEGRSIRSHLRMLTLPCIAPLIKKATKAKKPAARKRGTTIRKGERV